MPQWFFIMALALFGLLFGSFANVVIWRLPRDESIVHPGSHCPVCDAHIGWRQNIPLLSYLVLRGRCGSCGAPISARYPVVEALSGTLFAIAAVRFGVGVTALIAAGFFWALLVLALIDLDHFRLPNAIVGSLAAVGTLGAVVAQVLGREWVPLVGLAQGGWLSQPLLAAAAGAFAAGGLAFAVAEGYALVRKRPGLGMGDVKLLSALGIYLGLYAFMALVLGSILGTVYALVRAQRSDSALGEQRIPFGAFLALGAVVSALVGPALWGWYLRALGVG